MLEGEPRARRGGSRAAGRLASAARAAEDSPLGGAEVKALFVGDPFAQASQRIIADLNQLAGGTISMQVVDFDSMHQKILLDAPSAAPAFDVYSWEFSWLGEMVGANALRPLDDFVERATPRCCRSTTSRRRTGMPPCGTANGTESRCSRTPS